jgi:hypothetical protein
MFSDQKGVYVSSNAYYTYFPSYALYLNIITIFGEEYIVIMQFSPASSYFITFYSKYSLQPSFLRHSRPPLFV